MSFLQYVAFTLVGSSTALRTTAGVDANATQCKSCNLVHVDKTLSLTWSIFPPNPIAGYSLSVYCSPQETVGWDDDPQVEAALEEGCGFETKDADLKSADSGCREQSAATKKRASSLGIPGAWFRQMIVCGRCTVCTAFTKVQNLWKKIKAALQKVVDKLTSVKTRFFGYSYAPSSVRKEMQERFDRIFPEDASSASSFGQSFLQQDQQDEQEMTEEKVSEKVEEAFNAHFSGKSEQFIQHHLSLLQLRLQELEQNEEELMTNARRKLMDQTQKSQRMLQEKLPDILNNKDCQEVLGTSVTGSTLTSTLTVSFPNIASAILSAVLLNFAGALYALIPGVYLSATPKGFQRFGSVDRCLDALRQDQIQLLDSCSNEEPLMACTTQTYQRIMENALSQKWWPLMHNAEGTFGSIDLGYKYDELMNSLKCSSQRSCLEKGLDHLGKDNLREILENSSTEETDRLSEMQCSFAANRVDVEDHGHDKSGQVLPVFTDKIWAVALKAHGATLSDTRDINTPCPDILPWVMAFCSSEFRCMDSSHEEKDLDDLDQQWEALVRSKFDDSDASQWAQLWHLTKVTNKQGLMSSWPEILEALSGKRKIDWSTTRLHWEKVLFTSLMRLQIRESQHGPRNVRDPVALSEVFLNLQSIHQTKLCSPGALGGLKEVHLRRLGVTNDDLVPLAFHDLDKEQLFKVMWRNWLVLHVDLTRSGVNRRRLERVLSSNSCSCMCYKACSKLQASAVGNCQLAHPTNTSEGDRIGRSRVIKRMRAKQVVIDRIGRPASTVLNNAVSLKVLKKSSSACGAQLEVRDRYNAPIRGFISKCSEYFEQSKDLGVTITLWTNPSRDDKVYDYDDFLALHRPFRDWSDKVFDDDSVFGDEEEEDDHGEEDQEEEDQEEEDQEEDDEEDLIKAIENMDISDF